jgi:CubicO group peptidase (beta-lactamase class C family)
MKKILLLLLAAPCFAIAQQQQLDSLFASQKDFSGVVLVANHGNIIYHKAFGFREFAGKQHLLKNDIFELASVSKQYTAMIIMMLKEKGLLGYDDLAEKYVSIPYKGITIRHLLTHTSGLPDYQAIMDEHWDKSKVAGNADCNEYLNKFAPAKLFEPGTKYEYSNTGYLLLASIAEKASGNNFIELCRQWIFRPLQMNNTNIRTLAEKATTKNFALGHMYVKDRQQYIRADSFPSSNYTIWLGNRKGPGRISSTATDLLKWDQALYSNKLVKQSTLQEAFTPMQLNDGSKSYYGFGWMLRTDNAHGKVVYHTGDNPGYKTEIIRFIDQKQTIILLCNNAHENFEQIVSGMEAILE